MGMTILRKDLEDFVFLQLDNDCRWFGKTNEKWFTLTPINYFGVDIEIYEIGKSITSREILETLSDFGNKWK